MMDDDFHVLSSNLKIKVFWFQIWMQQKWNQDVYEAHEIHAQYG